MMAAMTSWTERARQLADEVLAPHAAEVDRTGEIPRENFDRLAEAGLYGISMREDVGLDAFTDVGEVLIAGCLATSFVWAQHLGVARRIANSPNVELRERLTEDIRSGRVRSGVSYAGAAERPSLLARRRGTGYALEGTAPFITGWGMVDVIGVVARDAEDPESLISLIVPAEAGPRLRVEPLPLTAVDASRTVTAAFDGLTVPDSAVDSRFSLRSFHASYIVAAWRNGSLALGLVRRALTELPALGVDTTALAAESAAIRKDLDAALTGQGDIYTARAAASELAVRAANTLVTATGSAALVRGSLAERTSREATFTLVFGSRPGIKSALLERFAGPDGKER
ncbi:acyl-CoA dehydrogenase [Nocardia arthritidis]|uniref:Acyl-CoA dehydrogenase n=2 Tax=Nocardia arthritidis TaxID=228602 RepID=A0A6G9Y5N1_9NOCA|nr:acyl-CoA dehydrogenase [Nocardia arthritidis]